MVVMEEVDEVEVVQVDEVEVVPSPLRKYAAMSLASCQETSQSVKRKKKAEVTPRPGFILPSSSPIPPFFPSSSSGVHSLLTWRRHLRCSGEPAAIRQMGGELGLIVDAGCGPSSLPRRPRPLGLSA